MIKDNQITEPLLFNPLKHHLGFIMEFVNMKIDEPDSDIKDLVQGTEASWNICNGHLYRIIVNNKNL